MKFLAQYDSFILEQMDSFFKDLDDSKKNIKLFTSFEPSHCNYTKTDIIVADPKRRFYPKIKTTIKKHNNEIF